jgi:hypothetical protein
VRAGDWCGRLADQPTGAEVLFDAATGEPLKTLAAHGDPHQLDRQPTAEIAHHRGVSPAGRPTSTTSLGPRAGGGA